MLRFIKFYVEKSSLIISGRPRILIQGARLKDTIMSKFNSKNTNEYNNKINKQLIKM